MTSLEPLEQSPSLSKKLELARFGSLYQEPSRNGIYKTDAYRGRGTRIVNMREMFAYERISDQEMSLVELTAQERSISGLNDGDLLFGRRSVVPAGAGKCSIVVRPRSPLTFESSIIRVRLDTAKVVPTFYFYYFASNIGRANVGTIVAGTNIKGIRASELREIAVPVPPMAEQKAIAEALSDADAYIESLKQLLVKKRDVKQGVMQKLFSGSTRLSGYSAEWALRRLGDVGYAYVGLIGKTKNDFGAGDAFYITFMNIMNNVVVDRESLRQVIVTAAESQNAVSRGDLFFNGSSETPEEVGMCSLLADEVSRTYLNSFCFGFRINDFEVIDGLYLAHFFRSEEGRNLLKSLAQGATRYNLSKSALMNVRVPIPSIEEQREIRNIMADLDSEIRGIELRRVKATAVKQGMMQNLLTGKVRLV